MKAKYLFIWALCISSIFLGVCATLHLQEIYTDPSPVVGDRTPFTIHVTIFNETNQTFDDIQLRVFLRGLATAENSIGTFWNLSIITNQDVTPKLAITLQPK